MAEKVVMTRFECPYCSVQFISKINPPKSCPKCKYKLIKKPKLIREAEI